MTEYRSKEIIMNIGLADFLYENEKALMSDEEKKEIFVVDTPEKADWAIAKISQAANRKEQRAALVAQYKEKLDIWLRKENEDDESSILYLTEKVRPYVEQAIKGGKKKSMSFHGGTAGFRKGSERVEIIDENAAVSFCDREHPEVVKKSVGKTELKKLISNGVKVPGVTIEQAPDNFYVKPSEVLRLLDRELTA
jgi:phage host-nuclease inhibitor protein Gam